MCQTQGRDPNRIKRVGAWQGLLKVCRAAVPQAEAWMCSNWLAAQWPGKWQGMPRPVTIGRSACKLTEAYKQRSCGCHSDVCERAFCWAWLNFNKRRITKVWRHLSGPSPVGRLVRVDFFQFSLSFPYFISALLNMLIMFTKEGKKRKIWLYSFFTVQFSPILYEQSIFFRNILQFSLQRTVKWTDFVVEKKN